jgi:hypothetical protein
MRFDWPFFRFVKGQYMSKKFVVAFVSLLAASVSFVAIAENKDDARSQNSSQCPSACATQCASGCPATAARECAASDCARQCASKACAKECAAKACDKACAKQCPASAATACAKTCAAACKKDCAADCKKDCAADCKKDCAADCKKDCAADCKKDCAADCKKECCGEAKCKATCPVSGKAADMAVSVDYNGGKVYLCCPGCPGAFKKDTAKFAAKANHQLVVTGQAKQVGCPISGGKVNADTTTELCGVKVGFCCNGCKGKATKAEGDEQVAMLFGEKAFKKGFKVAEKKDAE